MNHEVDTKSATGARMLSVSSLAELLDLSERQIRRFDTMGRIPKPYRLGRSIRWRYAEIVDWLDAGMPDREEWEITKAELKRP